MVNIILSPEIQNKVSLSKLLGLDTMSLKEFLEHNSVISYLLTSNNNFISTRKLSTDK